MMNVRPPRAITERERLSSASPVNAARSRTVERVDQHRALVHRAGRSCNLPSWTQARGVYGARANAADVRSGVVHIQCRPTLGSTTPNGLAVPPRRHTFPRHGSRSRLCKRTRIVFSRGQRPKIRRRGSRDHSSVPVTRSKGSDASPRLGNLAPLVGEW